MKGEKGKGLKKGSKGKGKGKGKGKDIYIYEHADLIP